MLPRDALVQHGDDPSFALAVHGAGDTELEVTDVQYHRAKEPRLPRRGRQHNPEELEPGRTEAQSESAAWRQYQKEVVVPHRDRPVVFDIVTSGLYFGRCRSLRQTCYAEVLEVRKNLPADLASGALDVAIGT